MILWKRLVKPSSIWWPAVIFHSIGGCVAQLTVPFLLRLWGCIDGTLVIAIVAAGGYYIWGVQG